MNTAMIRAINDMLDICRSRWRRLPTNTPEKKSIAAVSLVPAFIEQLQAERDRFRTALAKISFPLKHLCEDCPPDSRVDGPMAVQLANDPNYLKSIASDAIRDTEP